ncbi:MAG: hypothetical protein ABIA67_02750 [Candidatus Margulisiibacteriota bacterium]
MNPHQKLQQDVKKFLEVYKILSPEGKAQFEAQMAGEIKGLDEKTKKLYSSLLQSAKDGKDIAGAIQEMGQA